MDPEKEDILKELREMVKSMASDLKEQGKEIVKFSVIQDRNNSDIADLKNNMKCLNEQVSNLKTAEAIEETLRTLKKWNEQTMIRPIILQITNSLLPFILAGILIWMNSTSNNRINTTAQQQINNGTKTVQTHP